MGQTVTMQTNRRRNLPARLLALSLASLALLACTEASEPPSEVVAQPVPAQETRTVEDVYVVQLGDNLARIAAAHDATISELMALNEIVDPAVIEVGDEIVVERRVVRLRTPAPSLAVTSPAAGERGVLAELPEWPVELSRGQSATAFVLVAGAAAGLLVYAMYAALTLTYEGASARMGGLRIPFPSRGSARPADGDAETSEEAAADESAATRSVRHRASAAAAQLWLSSRRGAASATRVTARGLRSALARGWPLLRAGVLRGLALAAAATQALGRGARRLGVRGGETYERAARGRRRAQLRAKLEEDAEVPLRLGLVEGAEQRFREALEECEREGWDLEAALCRQGLASIAAAQGDRPRAESLLDEAIAVFDEAGAHNLLLRARMRKQLLEQQ